MAACDQQETTYCACSLQNKSFESQYWWFSFPAAFPPANRKTLSTACTKKEILQIMPCNCLPWARWGARSLKGRPRPWQENLKCLKCHGMGCPAYKQIAKEHRRLAQAGQDEAKLLGLYLVRSARDKCSKRVFGPEAVAKDTARGKPSLDKNFRKRILTIRHQSYTRETGTKTK